MENFEKSEFIDIGIGKGISSPKELVLAHLNRMSINIFQGQPSSTLRQKENLEIIKTPDKRETFISAVDFLFSLLQPYYDGTMQQRQKTFNTDLITLEKELIVSAIADEAYKFAFDSNKHYKNREQIFNSFKTFFTNEKIIVINKTSNYYEYYILNKYNFYLKLFQELQFLLFRKKWLVIEDYSEDEEGEE